MSTEVLLLKQLHEKMGDMNGAIIHTLSYFAFFQYAPTFDELYLFLPNKITRTLLQKELDTLVKNRKIYRYLVGEASIHGKKVAKYTLGEYSRQIQKSKIKIKNTLEKIKKASRFIRLLSLFPQIKLIGLSGSVAMMNADEDDDVDIFIIASHGRMWTARIIGLLLAHIMGLRRKRSETKAQDKVCLNLFFDERNLQLPRIKQTEYGAHEVLQMKPLVNKAKTYEQFLKANKWIIPLFPNAESGLSGNRAGTIIFTEFSSTGEVPFGSFFHGFLKIISMTMLGTILRLISETVEHLLSIFQLFIIKRHQTTETVTPTQLWFFPDDFEKRLARQKKTPNK